LLAIIHGFALVAAEEPTAEQLRFFENKVRPVLAEHCLKCHGPEKQWSSFRLDSREALLKGGESGIAVVPGKPEESLLIQAVHQTDDAISMPPEDKLTASQIAHLEEWVRQGVPFPAQQTTAQSRYRDPQHWSFQPMQNPSVPTVKDAAWPKSPLDHFILAKLEEAELKPAPPADRRTLIRRATFDLTGLPPTPEEVEAFLNDNQPDAFARLVDRLLDSPAYGERWGRHWLDVARYADSNGLDENVAHGNAWRYRDYVVAAFNNDKPFNDFVREQLAGDLLPAADDQVRAEQLIATGFLALGPKVLAEVDEKKMEMDIVDEQIDTVGRAFLGLTLGCARCHDHKFDPIDAADYYGLAGIFKSTRTMETFKKVARWYENPLPVPVADGSSAEKPTAMGATERDVTDVAIHLRGSHLKLGDVIPRRVPVVFTSLPSPTFATQQSGRLELANWLTDAKHPLTHRVLVNRVWRWHFGKGLVRTPDNFGLLGEAPTHPDLLDWLALQFLERGTSIKELHRLIMLSSTYQQSSLPQDATAQADPENRLWGRFEVRRLEAEAVRDALIAVGGKLDRTVGGSLLEVKNRAYFFDHTSKDKTNYNNNRCSIYLPIVRNNVYDVFQLLDYPDAAVSSGDRATTTIAPQALLMMNSDLVARASAALAQRVTTTSSDNARRLATLYALAYGREPTAEEVAADQQFLRDAEQALQATEADEAKRSQLTWECLCQVVLAANEFIYVR
jgi:hypothetical protein